MKNILFIASILMLASCKPETQVRETDLVHVRYSQGEGKRIKLKESTQVDGDYISIIQIDSVEYAMPSKGGIVRLTKD